jgi:hypothetical protein
MALLEEEEQKKQILPKLIREGLDSGATVEFNPFVQLEQMKATKANGFK